jgi:hypothetical protein
LGGEKSYIMLLLYFHCNRLLRLFEYIDNRTTKIEKLVSTEQLRIVTLKEHRQGLISEVVTEKIKVTKKII